MTFEQQQFLDRYADLISPWKFTAGERQRLAYMRLAHQWRESSPATEKADG